ncbi:GerAB/ArcD/ProY family transporter [Alkalihalobacterium alkalinitrilicum]|uniref:GerAB/ArcD/ProY family transporter n=1 Tax=Alkalihalobacterium alkalinitrilicum TaxID=427920 RepID=UPI0013034332|nr:endospore germination permease [Alkalihalobacterium alkalinitrilicum]
MERISGIQTVFIGALYILTVGIKQSPILMFETAKQDSWISLIVAFFVMILSVWLFTRILARFPNDNLLEILKMYSPIIGRIIILIYLYFFILVIAHDIRFLIDLITVIFLPTTPLNIIGMFTLLLAVLMAREGIEVLARLAQLFFIPFTVILLLLPLFLLDQIDFNNMQPVLEDGYSIFQGSIYALGTLGELVILPLICTAHSFRFRYGMYGLVVGTFLIGIMLVHILLVFGASLATVFFDPAYILVRQIRVTDFLDRMDIIIAALWLPTIFVKISFTLFVICKGIQNLSNKISGKLLVPPMGVFSFVCSVWFFEHATQLIHFDRVKPVFIIMTTFVVPIFLYFYLKNSKQNITSKSM